MKLNCGEYGILTRQRKAPYKTSAGKDYSFLHIEELFGTDLDNYPDSENYLADSEFCEIINAEEFDYEGSDDEAGEPIETPRALSLFHTHKDKIIIGGSVFALFILGIMTSRK